MKYLMRDVKSGRELKVWDGPEDQLERNTLAGAQAEPAPETANGAARRRADPRADRARVVRRRIRAIEASQQRAMREALLGKDGALERLQEIDDRVAALRKLLQDRAEDA